MKDKKPEVITEQNTPPEQLSAWARWELPNMESEIPVRGNAFQQRDQSKQAQAAANKPADEPEIKPPTLEEIEAIRQSAFDEARAEGLASGHAEGLEKGYQEGFGQGESDIKAAVTRLGQISRVLLEPIPQQDEELEAALLQLVENICRRVVQRELKLDSEGLKTIVSSALESLNPGSQRLRIHLNPDDHAMITQYLQNLGELEEGWRVVPHPTITPGGCIVETDNSLVDARAEKRLAAVIQQVYERQQQALDEESRHQGSVEQLMDEVSAFPQDDLDQNELDIDVAGEPQDDL